MSTQLLEAPADPNPVVSLRLRAEELCSVLGPHLEGFPCSHCCVAAIREMAVIDRLRQSEGLPPVLMSGENAA
jgi:hypothetical protein